MEFCLLCFSRFSIRNSCEGVVNKARDTRLSESENEEEARGRREDHTESLRSIVRKSDKQKKPLWRKIKLSRRSCCVLPCYRDKLPRYEVAERSV